MGSRGPDGFFDGKIDGLGDVAMGICKWPTKSFERMDLNPYKFEAPWSAWEFAYHILHKQANLVILSMAWLTRENPRSYSRSPKDPDMDTLSYWLARIEPLIRAETEGEIIVVFANRTGTEEEAVYAGTSAVLGIQSGEVKVYGILGRGEKELLVVDTSKRPQAKLVSESSSAISEARKSTPLDKSNSSMNTEATASTLSSSNGRPVTMEDVLAPLSPVDPISPHAYFSLTGHGPDVGRRENLKSSIRQAEHSEPSNSSTLKRPQSPKSRNASRTREPEQQRSPPISYGPTDKEEAALRAVGTTPPHSAAATTTTATDTATAASDPHKACASAASIPEESYPSPRPKSAAW